LLIFLKDLFSIMLFLTKADLMASNAIQPNIIRRAKVLILMTSTFGSGAAPSSAKPMLELLARETTLPSVTIGKLVAVVGLGSSSYPKFCAAGEMLQNLVDRTRMKTLVPLTKLVIQCIIGIQG
jgi:flavodoxin